jgi:hypothetical protein
MSTDTKAFFPNATREQIVKVIKLWDPGLKARSAEDYTVVNFMFKDDSRMLHINDHGYFTGAKGLPHNIDKGTWTSFGAYGRAVEIIKMLCYMLGGYILERDTESEPFYRVNKNPQKFIKVIFT